MTLKGQSISWHCELMFTRPLYGWNLSAQNELLTKVAQLVDAGRIRTTLTQTYSPIDAAQLRLVHAELKR